MEEINTALRPCTSCGLNLPATEKFFCRRKTKTGGLTQQCRACVNLARKRHRDSLKAAHPARDSQWNQEGKLLCLACREFKPPDMYDSQIENIHRRGLERRCKACRGGQARALRTRKLQHFELSDVLKQRWVGARDRAEKKGLPFSIDPAFLRTLWTAQAGVCAVSGVAMTFVCGKGRTPTNVSLDQIDPKAGYTKGNVQLVCSAVNQMKGDLTGEQLLMFCAAIVAQKKRPP